MTKTTNLPDNPMGEDELENKPDPMAEDIGKIVDKLIYRFVQATLAQFGGLDKESVVKYQKEYTNEAKAAINAYTTNKIILELEKVLKNKKLLEEPWGDGSGRDVIFHPGQYLIEDRIAELRKTL